MIYFIIPRCIIYIAFIVVCGSIFRIITAGIQKAEDAIKMEVFQKELKSKVDEQTVEIREQQKKIEEAYLQIVTALSEAVDAKDRYTSGHSKRVAEYSKMIAKRMGKSDSEQENIYRAGLLHDIGKAADFELEGSHVEICLSQSYEKPNILSCDVKVSIFFSVNPPG